MAAVRLGSYKNTRREAMTVGTAATRIRSSVTTIGLAHTLHDLTLRAANRALVVKILKGMTA